MMLILLCLTFHGIFVVGPSAEDVHAAEEEFEAIEEPKGSEDDSLIKREQPLSLEESKEEIKTEEIRTGEITTGGMSIKEVTDKDSLEEITGNSILAAETNAIMPLAADNGVAIEAILFGTTKANVANFSQSNIGSIPTPGLELAVLGNGGSQLLQITVTSLETIGKKMVINVSYGSMWFSYEVRIYQLGELIIPRPSENANGGIKNDIGLSDLFDMDAPYPQNDSRYPSWPSLEVNGDTGGYNLPNDWYIEEATATISLDPDRVLQYPEAVNSASVKVYKKDIGAVDETEIWLQNVTYENLINGYKFVPGEYRIEFYFTNDSIYSATDRPDSPLYRVLTKEFVVLPSPVHPDIEVDGRLRDVEFANNFINQGLATIIEPEEPEQYEDHHFNGVNYQVWQEKDGGQIYLYQPSSDTTGIYYTRSIVPRVTLLSTVNPQPTISTLTLLPLEYEVGGITYNAYMVGGSSGTIYLRNESTGNFYNATINSNGGTQTLTTTTGINPNNLERVQELYKTTAVNVYRKELQVGWSGNPSDHLYTEYEGWEDGQELFYPGDYKIVLDYQNSATLDINYYGEQYSTIEKEFRVTCENPEMFVTGNLALIDFDEDKVRDGQLSYLPDSNTPRIYSGQVYANFKDEDDDMRAIHVTYYNMSGEKSDDLPTMTYESTVTDLNTVLTFVKPGYYEISVDYDKYIGSETDPNFKAGDIIGPNRRYMEPIVFKIIDFPPPSPLISVADEDQDDELEGRLERNMIPNLLSDPDLAPKGWEQYYGKVAVSMRDDGDMASKIEVFACDAGGNILSSVPLESVSHTGESRFLEQYFSNPNNAFYFSYDENKAKPNTDGILSNVYKVVITYEDEDLNEDAVIERYFEILAFTPPSLNIVNWGDKKSLIEEINWPTAWGELPSDALPWQWYSGFVETDIVDELDDILYLEYVFYEKDAGGAFLNPNSPPSPVIINREELGLTGEFRANRTFHQLKRHFSKLGIYHMKIVYLDEYGNENIAGEENEIWFEISLPLYPNLEVWSEESISATVDKGVLVQRFRDEGYVNIVLGYPEATTYIPNFTPQGDQNDLVLTDLTLLRKSYLVEREGVEMQVPIVNPTDNILDSTWEPYDLASIQGEEGLYEAFVNNDLLKANPIPITEPGEYAVGFDFYNADNPMVPETWNVTGKMMEQRFIIFTEDEVLDVAWNVDGASYADESMPQVYEAIEWHETIPENWRRQASLDETPPWDGSWPIYYDSALLWATDEDSVVLGSGLDIDILGISVAYYPVDEESLSLSGYVTTPTQIRNVYQENGGPVKNYLSNFSEPGLYIARLLKRDPWGQLYRDYRVFEIISSGANILAYHPDNGRILPDTMMEVAGQPRPVKNFLEEVYAKLELLNPENTSYKTDYNEEDWDPEDMTPGLTIGNLEVEIWDEQGNGWQPYKGSIYDTYTGEESDGEDYEAVDLEEGAEWYEYLKDKDRCLFYEHHRYRISFDFYGHTGLGQREVIFEILSKKELTVYELPGAGTASELLMTAIGVMLVGAGAITGYMKRVKTAELNEKGVQKKEKL
jgi:hypothetical protein